MLVHINERVYIIQNTVVRESLLGKEGKRRSFWVNKLKSERENGEMDTP